MKHFIFKGKIKMKYFEFKLKIKMKYFKIINSHSHKTTELSEENASGPRTVNATDVRAGSSGHRPQFGSETICR